MKYLTLFFVLIVTTIPCSSQDWKEQHVARHISMSEDLPHNNIDDIYKDSRGFLWISTSGGGLVRYDGYEFITFDQHSPNHQLKSNFVHSVCEDNHGRLWVGSQGGVDIIDIYSLDPVLMSLPSIDECETYRMYFTRSENMWISNKEALYRITMDDYGRLDVLDTILSQSIDNIAFDLYEDSIGNVIVGIGNHVYSYTGDSVRQNTILTLPVGNVIRSLQLWDNEIWVGTQWNLIRYNLQTDVSHTYYSNQGENTLSQNFITDIVLLPEVTGDTCLIISTLKGFNIYRPMTDDFERITCEDIPASGQPLLNCNFINCMMVHDGTLWVGTEADGISFISPRTLHIQNCPLVQSVNSKTSSYPINCIHTNPYHSERLWVGTVEGGLFDISTRASNGVSTTNSNMKQFSLCNHLTNNAPYPTGISHNAISYLCYDGQGQLWLGTWGGGVCIQTDTIISHPHFHHLYSHEHPSFAWEMIRSMCYDDINDYMWIAGDKIYAYDLTNDTLKTPLDGLGIKEMQKGNVGICIDSENMMWMNTRNGLLAISLKDLRHNSSPRLFQWKTIAGQLNMQEVKTTFIALDNQGSLWIGTDGYGIIQVIKDLKNIADTTSYTFQQFTTQDGLLDNNVRAFLVDDNNCLWISTIKGISCYNPIDGQFHNFTTADGILSSPFYINAAHKGNDGTLYFGTMIGVTAITPLRTKMMQDKKTVFPAFTQVHTAERSLSTHTNCISFHEREKVLSVRFSSLTFEPTPVEAYAYRLQGFDNENSWTYTKERSATYTNLQPGTYTLQVKYAADGQHWISNMAELQIEVEPYFYKTWWFKFVSFVLLLFAVYAFYSWRVNTLKQQKKLLHQKVQEHTLTLRKQKDELIERAQELEQKNLLLIEKNEEIIRQKNEIMQMAQQQFAYSMSPEELHIPVHSPDAELLNKTLEIIKENYFDPKFEISDIINTLGVSRTVLYTKIQKLTGDSIGNLLRNYRLNMAHHLIAETQPSQSLTIAEIAYRVGFNDPKYFSRCFAKQFGCPPSKVLDEKNE